MPTEHINADSLRPLLRATGAQQQDVALAADVSATAMQNYASGYRVRAASDVRARIAQALTYRLGHLVTVRAITCMCPDPSVHRENADA